MACNAVSFSSPPSPGIDQSNPSDRGPTVQPNTPSVSYGDLVLLQCGSEFLGVNTTVDSHCHFDSGSLSTNTAYFFTIVSATNKDMGDPVVGGDSVYLLLFNSDNPSTSSTMNECGNILDGSPCSYWLMASDISSLPEFMNGNSSNYGQNQLTFVIDTGISELLQYGGEFLLTNYNGDALETFSGTPGDFSFGNGDTCMFYTPDGYIPTQAGQPPVTPHQIGQCCIGTTIPGVDCSQYVPGNAACNLAMLGFYGPSINGAPPAIPVPVDATQAIQKTFNEYINILNSPEEAAGKSAFINTIWTDFWNNRRPTQYISDYDTFANHLTEGDKNGLDLLTTWCSSADPTGLACSAQVSSGTGICTGLSLADFSSQDNATDNARLARICGCNLANNPTNYPWPNVQGVQCSPICVPPGTIQQSGGGGRCTETICVIDQLAINSVNSSIGNSGGAGITINQVCGGSNSSACYIDVANIDAINSSIQGGVNFNQVCGTCYDLSNNNEEITCSSITSSSSNGGGNGITSKVKTTVKSWWSWLEKNPIVAIGIVVVIVLFIFLIVWAVMSSGKKDEDKEDYQM